jgi:hypothetical protein
MTISSRDKRALILLAVAVVLVTVYSLSQPADGAPKVISVSGSAAAAEQRLAQLRRLGAQVPAREQQAKALAAELESREKAVLRPETAQQAQAELLKIMRRLGSSQTPPLEFRSEEIGLVRPVGKDKNYGEVLVSVSLKCPVEQLVNLLADLTAQPEAIATEELRIAAGNPKDKNLTVRLTVSGLVPHRLVPEQKGLAAF